MLPKDWQLPLPLDAIIFDCDGTLSRIEGIDTLASWHHVAEPVKALTARAMAETGLTPTIYHERLHMTRPSQHDMIRLGKKYIAELTEDTQSVIRTLQKLEKKIYIISAGLTPSILLLGNFLNIEQSHVFAVNIQFDTEGHYIDFDRNSPLATNQGKCVIVNQLKKQHENIGYIGDGLNDCPVMPLVNRFVGYGGAYFRETIAARCQYYITSASMAPLLPLILTAKESSQLQSMDRTLWEKGYYMLLNNNVRFSSL